MVVLYFNKSKALVGVHPILKEIRRREELMINVKSLSASIIVLSVCILISAWLVSNAITNSKTNFPSSIDVNQSSNGQYELLVIEGWLYLYDTTNGQVFKKPDDSNSSWETVKHYTEY